MSDIPATDAINEDGLTAAEVAELENDEEKIARSGIPAIYIDTWFLTTWRGHMRITFGETVSKIDAYRSAIVLELNDAEKLSRQILKMIERRKEKEIIRASQQAPDTSEG